VSGDHFLSRWSKRKHAANRGEAPGEPAPVVTPSPSVTEQQPKGAAPSGTPQPLPPVETLTPESDFTPFMKPEVDADVKRAALRTLFRDPRYNVMDGLDVYIDDYSKPDPIPQEWLGQLNQLAHLGDVHAREAEKAARAENAPEPAGIEAKTEQQQVVDAAEGDHSSHTDNKELPPPEVRHS